jgi:hypothetical protein
VEHREVDGDSMNDEQVRLWREAIRKPPPIKHCGRLDLSTTLADPIIAGRVESDVIRYVYFTDGEEVICVGDLADHVAFRAADYDRRVEALQSRLKEALDRLEGLGVTLPREE